VTTLPPHGYGDSGPPPTEIAARQRVIASRLANHVAELVLGTLAGRLTNSPVEGLLAKCLFLNLDEAGTVRHGL
jgi:hypothetical protein